MWGLLDTTKRSPSTHRTACRTLADGARGRDRADLLNEAMLLTSLRVDRDALARTGVDPEPAAGTCPERVAAYGGTTRAHRNRSMRNRGRGADHAFAEHASSPIGSRFPAPGSTYSPKIYGLAECGRLDEATGRARLAYERDAGDGAPRRLDVVRAPPAAGSRCCRAARTARRWLAEALGPGESASVGPSRLVLSALATAAGAPGDAASGAAARPEFDQSRISRFADPNRKWDGPGRSWSPAIFADGADATSGRRSRRPTATCGCEASAPPRRRPAGRSRGVGRPAASSVESAKGREPLSWRPRRHAVAAPGGARRTRRRGQPYEQMGAMLLAAEAANEAAQAYQRVGDRRTSAGVHVLELRGASRCACEGREHRRSGPRPGSTTDGPRTGHRAPLATQGASRASTSPTGSSSRSEPSTITCRT